MNLNGELLEKAKEAKNSEDLILLAKESGFDLTEEEADRYFARLNPKSGEIGDDELGDVSGGGKCGTTYYEGHPVVTAFNSCEYYRFESYWYCGNDKAGSGQCRTCLYCHSTGWISYCNCDKRYDN